MNDEQPTLEQQLHDRERQSKRQHDELHAENAKRAAQIMLANLAAVDFKKVDGITTIDGQHFRIRIDVISDRKAKRLSKKISRGERIWTK